MKFVFNAATAFGQTILLKFAILTMSKARATGDLKRNRIPGAKSKIWNTLGVHHHQLQTERKRCQT